ncbi:HAD family hydrolase [Clostridium aminobutyricum]|uniref:HAD family phosphatase n=1 Tax=Clostridium aminobutyricum TaxID=33953 RepID=A0A939D8C6_CLOAM|nr:HAD family phosphatase [Clostridium aminobutyricum]MBN7773102.1 HAD family phosphatase [Clostridium aminobutyricum]
MNIKGAIFDMDGTLLESMHIWETVGSDYLKNCGIEPAADLREQIKTLSLRDCAEYFYLQYGLDVPIEEIMSGINETIADFYAKEVWLKPGALQLLEKLAQRGVVMCIATATDRELVEAALKTTNIRHFFKEILTCTEVGAGKESPAIFEKALTVMGVPKSETVVFEDALHAIQTAKKAGFKVIAVGDPFSEPDREEIIQIADYYYDTLEEMRCESIL